MAKEYNVGGVMLPRPFNVQRFSHVGLSMDNTEESRDFWAQNLGFRVSDVLAFPGMDEPLGWFTQVGTEHHSVVHINSKIGEILGLGPDLGFAKGLTANHLSFQVGTLEEVVNANAYFEEQGFGNFRYGRDSPGSNWVNYITDPEGWHIELFYGMEQIGWNRQTKPPQLYSPPMYTPQLPERSEMQEIMDARAEHGELPPGFSADEPAPYDYEVGGVMLQQPFSVDKVGPVYMFVENIERALEFYTKHFGFIVTEESEYLGHRIIFLRCNSNHHVMGLFDLELKAKLDIDQRSRLFAMGVELGSYQQLRDAVAWLQGKGLDVKTDLPQELHLGIGYAALVTDPNGHRALLYSGMEQVGWDGQPRPADQRPVLQDEWPETLEAVLDTNMSLGRLGPMG